MQNNNLEHSRGGQPLALYVSKNGRQLGPYSSVEPVRSMLERGELAPTDLVWHAGRPDWIELGRFLAAPSSTASVSTSDAPMGLAAGAGKHLHNVEELERQIKAGGRFVIYQYCVSAIFVTMRRPSEVVFLRGDQSGLGGALAYTFLSLVAGWWGFPWGPIWTVSAVLTNLGGGKDLTREVLVNLVGSPRATEILAQRRPGRSESVLKSVRWIVAGAFLVLLVWLCWRLVLASR